MKESYKEDLANHFGLEPYAVDGNIGGVASARRNAGQLLNSTPFPETGLHFRVPILSCLGEGNTITTAHGKVADGRGGVYRTCACVDIPIATFYNPSKCQLLSVRGVVDRRWFDSTV